MKLQRNYCIILLFIAFLLEICETSRGGYIVESSEYGEHSDNFRNRRSTKGSEEVTTLPKHYNVHQPPPLIGGDPVPLEISVLVFNLFDIKEIQGDLTLEINLKLYWKDTRLANWTGNIEPGEKFTVLNPGILTQIWHPDIFMDHVKGISQPSLISKASSLRIYPDGSLRYSVRTLIVMTCQMDFYYYPADTQKCNVNMKSYAFSTKHIVLSWKDGQGPVMAYPITLHNFDVALDTDPDFLQQTKSGNYSGVSFAIYLRRKLSYHIIQTYIPSTLFTIVSWLSFLVPPESTPGRMALCVTTLLTLTAMFGAVRQNTPNVSYIKALDLWMVTCILFVFLSLAEYTVILKLRSKKEKPRKSSRNSQQLLDSTRMRAVSVSSNCSVNTLIKRHTTELNGNKEENQLLSLQPMIPEPIINDNVKKETKYFILAGKIDKYTPRIVPFIFLAFNFIYWPTLIFASQYCELKEDYEMYYSL